VDHQRTYLQRLDDIRALDTHADAVVVARAAGLLAGRVGCRVREAHVHLLEMAQEQGRELAEVAADVLAVLEEQSISDTDGRLSSAVTGALRPPTSRNTGRVSVRGTTTAEAIDPDPTTVQQILDALPGAHSWLLPVRDAAGQVVDYVTKAASPEAGDVTGRRGAQLVGVRVREAYPTVVDGPVWHAYRRALADGSPRAMGPMTYTDDADGLPTEARFSVRVHRLGPGLLVSWTIHDDARHSERIAQTERLGKLGWCEWDLISGQLVWSDELYRIYERDPALGPLGTEEASAMVLPEDHQIQVQAAETFTRGETTDVTYRVRVGGRVKHLRFVTDAVRNAAGHPLKIYGIVQDVTGRETTRTRLAEVERELHEHRQSLAAEHQLAAQLQHIILPIPDEPIDLPGLRVAVRYLPAERASRVGGDWYHAAALPDGDVLLAVGDVAGHGLQAATTMAQLRHALATLTVTTTTDPAELLGHLNRLLCVGAVAAGAASTATAVVARYDQARRSLIWAQAGHPAPLRTRAGSTVELPRPRGPLLGADPGAVYERATLPFEPGEVLLLYTDGLIEHRERSLEEGLAPVVATLNEISATGTQQPLADLLARLRRANPNDDTCLLAARPLPALPGTREPSPGSPPDRLPS
jgi:serine phosphatase RsbU (regulator of sigma subunit)